MHGNARLTPLSRAEMIKDIRTLGLTLRAAAAARSVSDRTVRRWNQRAIEEGLGDRLYERSCVPIHQPRKTPMELEAQIIALRRERKSYAQIVAACAVARATVWRVLKRHRLNRLKYLDPVQPPPIRYERERPGELVHLDIKKLGRFVRPGVRGTGQRADRSEGAGVESVHVAIDDHSRLGYACVLPDEKIPSVITALMQMVSFYLFHGIKVRAILTDNGSTYRSKAFASVCRKLRIKHLFTRPYRPQTNGKAERFIQTLTREWAYGFCYLSSHQRNGRLLDYINQYNWQRPHSALNHNPPISRLPLYAVNVSKLYS
jgi:transposase InsO family protein